MYVLADVATKQNKELRDIKNGGQGPRVRSVRVCFSALVVVSSFRLLRFNCSSFWLLRFNGFKLSAVAI